MDRWAPETRRLKPFRLSQRPKLAHQVLAEVGAIGIVPASRTGTTASSSWNKPKKANSSKLSKSKRKLKKSAGPEPSTSGNANAKLPVVHWFEHVPSPDTLDSDIELKDSHTSVQFLSRNDKEEASLSEQDVQIRGSSNEFEGVNSHVFQSASLDQFFSKSRHDQGSHHSTSQVRLFDGTDEDEVSDSGSINPNTHEWKISSRKPSFSNHEKNEAHHHHSSRKLRPGRYKVKVLENKKPPKRPQSKSPYRLEQFVDVDGKLKFTGKGFDAYITHPEYQLLKNFYIPGVTVSKVTFNRSRSKDLESRNRGTNHSSRSRSSSPVTSLTVQPSTSKLSNSSSARPNPKPLETKTTDSEQQTVRVDLLDTETQTLEKERRRSVAFDLENTIVTAFDPDFGPEVPDESPSKENLSSGTGISEPMSGDCGNDDDDEVWEIIDDPEYNFLWNQKITTAIRMVAAIISAQRTATDTLNSSLIQSALSNFPGDELEEMLELMTSSAGPERTDRVSVGEERDKARLFQLLTTYDLAVKHVYAHLRALEAFDSQIYGPDATIRGSRSDSISPKESVGDTQIESREAFRMDPLAKSAQQTQFLTPSSNFLRYGPEIQSDQFKVELRGGTEQMTQDIHLNYSSFRMKYGLRGVSTIQMATRTSEVLRPISTGNLILMQNQHASLAGSRIISAKYYLSRVVYQLMSIGELFLVGKYATLLSDGTEHILSKNYRRLREINVFTGILFQLSSHFVLACKKILQSLRQLVKFDGGEGEGNSVTLIGQPIKSKGQNPEEVEWTVPTSSVLRSEDSFNLLLSAFEDIDQIIVTAATSLRALDSRHGIRVRRKYYKTIVTFTEAVKQLEQGHDLDFGAVLVGYIVDWLLLQRLIGRQTESLVLDSNQRKRLFQNYQNLQHFLRELTRYGKKACLISSYAASKSMENLHRFRNSQISDRFGCLSVLTLFGRMKKRKRVQQELKIGHKKSVPDLSLETHPPDDESQRLAQMLTAISNESSLSATIF